jgi:hypothetical protein
MLYIYNEKTGSREPYFQFWMLVFVLNMYIYPNMSHTHEYCLHSPHKAGGGRWPCDDKTLGNPESQSAPKKIMTTNPRSSLLPMNPRLLGVSGSSIKWDGTKTRRTKMRFLRRNEGSMRKPADSYNFRQTTIKKIYHHVSLTVTHQHPQGRLVLRYIRALCWHPEFRWHHFTTF